MSPRHLALSILTATALAFPEIAHATEYTVAGFHAGSEAEQRQTQWCWAASLQAVLNYYGVDRTQEQIVQATYGGLYNLGAISPYQIYNQINSMTFSDGTMSVTKGTFGSGAPPASLLVDEIQHDHPVIAWYRHATGGHAVVIYGVDVTWSGAAPIVTSIDLFDPWPTEGYRSIGGSELASTMANYFVIRSASFRTQSTRPSTSGGGDSCLYANDGTCDEPDLCSRGTDRSDCSDGSRSEALPDKTSPQAYCCDGYGAPRCPIVNAGPNGSACFCPGQGYGFTCR